MENNSKTNKSKANESISIVATRVSMVGIIGNLILSAFKFLAGIITKSGAMISDAVHSSSDVFSSIIVIIGVRISAKESDREHPYGHERIECVAAMILSIVLAITGLAIGYTAITDIVTANYNESEMSGFLALSAAVISIICKEAMYWYTRYNAKKIDSSALMADAWHHRSDALSSIGAFIGIGGSMLGYPFMEPVASLIISIFICKVAVEIFKDAMDKMVDKSCDESFEAELRNFVLGQEGVLGIDLLLTRMFGNKIYVDLEIAAHGDISLNEAHEIAENVHSSIENTYPKIKHIMVHVNPRD